jgi:uncharacterized membrane protein YccC
MAAGVPVLVGWLLGDLTAGLLASLGAFPALYGQGRPYVYRARMLAVIAVGFALVVTVGRLVEPHPFLAVAVVAVLAAALTWVCRAWNTGPPGAYLFVLVAATGTALPSSDPAWWLALLVLAGGAWSWLLHMAGALVEPRGPERRTVAAGGAAVAALLRSVGTDDYPQARERAVEAMHHCWEVLVVEEPHHAGRGGTLAGLRAAAVELHALLTTGLRAEDTGRPVPAAALARAEVLAPRLDAAPDLAGPPARDDMPYGGQPPRRVARELLAVGSPWRVVLLRVLVGALVAGALGAVAGLDHAYWATAAAVLVLHQGLSWSGTLERATARLVGTWLGLLLAALVFAARPSALAVVVVIAVLQGAVQLIVARNYAVAVVLITPLALVVGTGGVSADPAALLLARGLDTLVGCAVGVLAYLLVAPGRGVPTPAATIAATLRAAADVLPHLADGSTASPAARRARRRLNQHLLALPEVYEAGIEAPSVRRRAAAVRWWPAIAATRGLADRVLTACWQDARIAGADAVSPALLALAAALEGGTPTRQATGVGTFLSDDERAVREALPARRS